MEEDQQKEDKWVRTNILKDHMIKIAKYVEQGKYSSKANFIDHAVRAMIKKEEDGDC